MAGQIPDRENLGHLLWEVGARVSLMSEAALARTPLTPRAAGMLEAVRSDPALIPPHPIRFAESAVPVDVAAVGAAYLSPRIAARVLSELRPSVSRTARDRVAELTPRERDVLALVGKGLSNQAIARRLNLAEGPVKAHVSTILARLGAENRVQAAITAYEAGLSAGG